MKNKSKNRKLIAIMVLPVFLATSFEPLWAAELMMGASGQVQSVVSPDQATEASLPVDQTPEDLFESSGALSAPTAAEAVAEGQVGEFQSGGCTQPTYSTSLSSTTCVGSIQTAEGVREIHKYDSRGNTGITIYNLESRESQSFDMSHHGNIDVSNFTSDGKYLALEHSFNQVSVISLHDLKLTGTVSVSEWPGAERHGTPTVNHVESVGNGQFLIRTNDSGVFNGSEGVTLSRTFDLKINPDESLDLDLVSSNVSVHPSSSVRIDNDRPYATQLIYHLYSNNWTLYVYDIRGGADNAKLIHSQFIHTGQAGGSSVLTHLDVSQNANGHDILNLSIDSNQIDASLSLNLTLLSMPLPAAVVLPGQLVDFIEDDRVSAYIYLNANGKRQAVIYDKELRKVISSADRVEVSAHERVIFFNAERVGYNSPKGYILHLDGTTSKLTQSNFNATQIYLTPNDGKIIFIAVQPDGDSTFGIYQLGNKTLYMHTIPNNWGLAAKIISSPANNQYAVLSVGSQGHILFISLSTQDKRPFKPETWIYNRDYDVVRVPNFVKGVVYVMSYHPADGTFKTTTNWGEQLVFKVTGNGQSVYLQQYEGWDRDGNPSRGYIDRQYTKIIFGADGKRNHMWIKKYDSRGRIEFEQEVIYDANGNVKRVIAYRYTLVRGKIVKVAV